MPWSKLSKTGFLLFVLMMSSGYRFRCYAFCHDQTAIQNDYIEQRDRCREYAELKLDMSLHGIRGPIEEKTQKTQLVHLFNECMGKNGWNIAPELNAANTPPPADIEASPVQEIARAQDEKMALSRSAECMFARHASKHSSIAAVRAKACDIECAQRLQAAPDAPRPAACPSDVEPDARLTHGGERAF